MLNHPARYKLSVAETIERMRIIQRAGWPLAALEVTDTGLYKPIYDTDEIPLAKIATDDAHRPPHFGRAWIEVEATPRPRRDHPGHPRRRFSGMRFADSATAGRAPLAACVASGRRHSHERRRNAD